MSDLAELELLAKAATPGPWMFTGDVESVPVTIASDPYADQDKQPGEAWLRNAAYIAAVSPDVVLRLIEQVRAVEAIS